MPCEEQISKPKRKETTKYKKLCPYCASKKITKKGTRTNKGKGTVQIFYCKKCLRRFTLNDGTFKMKNDIKKVTTALELYFNGMSLRKTQTFLANHFPHNASHMTVHRWIKKYGEQIGKFTDNIKVNNSDSIMFDEVEYKTKGKQSFFIGVMDLKSRYIVSSDFVYDRNLTAFNKVFSNAKLHSNNRVYKFYSDGLMIYKKALRQSYHYRNHWNKFQHHVKISTSMKKDFNWEIERFNNTLRERTKTMRGFKSLSSAKDFVKMFEIYYNYCRYHTGINAYPYELVTDLKLGTNKLNDLINLSSCRKV